MICQAKPSQAKPINSRPGGLPWQIFLFSMTAEAGLPAIARAQALNHRSACPQ
jgi:hypothetical protein